MSCCETKAHKGEICGLVARPWLRRLSWYFTRAMVAKDAIILFFQVMGLNSGATS